MKKSFNKLYTEAIGVIDTKVLHMAKTMSVKYKKGVIDISIYGPFEMDAAGLGWYYVNIPISNSSGGTVKFSNNDIKSWKWYEKDKTIQIELK